MQYIAKQILHPPQKTWQLATTVASRPDRDGHADTFAVAARLPSYLAWAALAFVIFLLNEYAFIQLRIDGGAMVGRENGPLENAQVLTILLALALFSFSGLKSRGAVGVAAILLGLLGTFALIREIDFESLSVSLPWLDWLVARGVQDAIFVFLGGLVLLYLFRRRRCFGGLFRLALRWQAWPCAASLLLLAAAEFYLDGFTGSTGHFWEELVEMNGYFLFLFAAWKLKTRIGDPKLDLRR